MTSPIALTALYRRVITARFVTRRDGTAMACEGCGSALVQGTALAALDATGAWHSYCPTCSDSYAGMVRGLYGRLQAECESLPTIPECIVTEVAALTPAVQAVVANPDSLAAFTDAFVRFGGLFGMVADARTAERVQVLQGDPLYAGLALATTWCRGRFQVAAESMLTQWERKGSLTANQVKYAEAIAAAARKAEAAATPAPDYAAELSAAIDTAGIADGYYAVAAVAGDNDLTFVRIGTSDTGVRIMRHIVGGKGETTPGLAWCLRVVAAIVAAGQDVAGLTYANEIGRCYKCNRHLTDQVSRDRGMGPVCYGG